MPALRLLQIDVSRLAEHGYRTAPLELRIFLVVGISAREMASRHVLCRAVLHQVDVAEGHLHRDPQHRRRDPGVVAGHVVRYGEVDGAIDVPPLDGHAGLVAQHVLTAEPAVRSDDRLGQPEDGLAQQHVSEDRIKGDRVSQDEGPLPVAVDVHLHVAAIVQAGVFYFRELGVVEQLIRSVPQRLHLAFFEHAGDVNETVPVEGSDDLLRLLLREWLAGLDRTCHGVSPGRQEVRTGGE